VTDLTEIIGHTGTEQATGRYPNRHRWGQARTGLQSHTEWKMGR